jgi:hypothetical protein
LVFVVSCFYFTFHQIRSARLIHSHLQSATVQSSSMLGRIFSEWDQRTLQRTGYD